MLLIFLFNTIASISQDVPAVNRDFENEMQTYPAGNSFKSLPQTTRCLIPDWVYANLPESGDTIFILGISDPGLHDTLAHQQAFIRAVALGSLACKTDCDHLSDWYKQSAGDENESTYAEIYRFSSKFAINPNNARIIQEIILGSTEVILLVGIPMQNIKSLILKDARVEALIYNNEADIVFGNQTSQKIDFSIQKRYNNEMIVLDESSFYQVNGKATGIRCFFPDSQTLFNSYEFYYTSGRPKQEAESNISNGTTCRQGLWIAYISQILEHLSMQAKLQCKDSESVNDNMEHSSRELLREKSRTLLTWRLNNIVIQDHKMKVNVNISKL